MKLSLLAILCAFGLAFGAERPRPAPRSSFDRLVAQVHAHRRSLHRRQAFDPQISPTVSRTDADGNTCTNLQYDPDNKVCCNVANPTWIAYYNATSNTGSCCLPDETGDECCPANRYVRGTCCDKGTLSNGQFCCLIDPNNPDQCCPQAQQTQDGSKCCNKGDVTGCSTCCAPNSPQLTTDDECCDAPDTPLPDAGVTSDATYCCSSDSVVDVPKRSCCRGGTVALENDPTSTKTVCCPYGSVDDTTGRCGCPDDRIVYSPNDGVDSSCAPTSRHKRALDAQAVTYSNLRFRRCPDGRIREVISARALADLAIGRGRFVHRGEDVFDEHYFDINHNHSSTSSLNTMLKRRGTQGLLNLPAPILRLQMRRLFVNKPDALWPVSRRFAVRAGDVGDALDHIIADGQEAIEFRWQHIPRSLMIRIRDIVWEGQTGPAVERSIDEV